MANLYVRSTDGNDADDGSTWALAKATLTGAAAIDAVGDRIYLSQNHAESTGAAISFAIAGTAASPVWIVCGNDAAEPPTAVSTAATISTGAGAYNITMNAVGAYIYGVGFLSGVGGSSTANINLNQTSGGNVTYSACGFTVSTTGTSSRVSVGGAGGLTILENCTMTFGATAQGINIAGGGEFRWNGGSISGGSAITTLFATASASSTRITVSGVDLSAAASTLNLFAVGNKNVLGIVKNCKLPASWSGALNSSAVAQAERYEMYNCDSGDTNYILHIVDYSGSILTETTIVRTGGASNGVTTISWKMVSGANAEYPLLPLNAPEIVRWNETTGSAITATIEVVTDNVTLTDAECWLEVQYLGTSGFPISSFISDAKADVLATAANQTTSTETWTTTGLTTPVKQKLSVTFTPQEKGYIHAVVKLAKASTTVYVDPEITVT